jgi:hypothetical protein
VEHLLWWFGVPMGRTAIGGGGSSPATRREPKCLVKVLAAYHWMDSRMGQGEWRLMVAGSVY